MRWLATIAVLILGQASAAFAQIAPFPRNPQIEILYVPPVDERYQRIHDRMRELRVLETLQQFLSPLKLGRQIVLKIDQCEGRMAVPYRPNGPVTLCYEHIAEIYANAPSEGVVPFGRGRQHLTSNQLVAGAVVQLLLHQTAYAAFDVLQIPVWGRIDDAADYVTGFIMLEFGEEVAWATLLGSAWFLAQRGMLGTGFFSDTIRGSEAQRFYNYLCIAYGARPNTYAFLVNAANLPERRAKWCKQDYMKLRAAFRDTFMPYIDRDLLNQARKRRWLPK
jgi:hypothetical protein